MGTEPSTIATRYFICTVPAGLKRRQQLEPYASDDKQHYATQCSSMCTDGGYAEDSNYTFWAPMTLQSGKHLKIVPVPDHEESDQESDHLKSAQDNYEENLKIVIEPALMTRGSAKSQVAAVLTTALYYSKNPDRQLPRGKHQSTSWLCKQLKSSRTLESSN